MITTVLLLCTLLMLFLLMRRNPLSAAAKRFADEARVNVGPHVRVMERDGDRLCVVEPDKTVLYNSGGVLYYYFEGGASQRFCPLNEYAVVRFTIGDIVQINDTGIYNITCTQTSSLNMYNHFQNESMEQRALILSASYTTVDIINYLIKGGYVSIY
ncbi:19k [Clostera anachoreta granulovirus]|uniref:19k n=1 Tax=Clostera anachoreta granulovirus TaxID=283675 RepID=F4ZKV1_9BBAC|nr:19k [Clostera anachoreta granulovirus]AEB00362.1 19k [Clostera anachoreta granulovirus]